MRTLFIIASWYFILLFHFYNTTNIIVNYLLQKLFGIPNDFPQQAKGFL